MKGSKPVIKVVDTLLPPPLAYFTLYNNIILGIIIFLTGELMRELTDTALSDVCYLRKISARGDKIVVCGSGGAALFKLIL